MLSKFQDELNQAIWAVEEAKHILYPPGILSQREARLESLIARCVPIEALELACSDIDPFIDQEDKQKPE